LLTTALLIAGLLAAGLLAGCASSSDLGKVSEENRVQDQRLRALEEDVAGQIARQQAALDALRGEVRALQGQLRLIGERNEQMAAEQAAMAQNLERNQAGQLRMTRLVEEESNRMGRFRTEAENDLDKMRVQLGQLEQLLRTPLARMPARTPADKELRAAHFLLIDGELDLAADRFEEFRKKYPDDARGVEALFRRGQAYFLLRKYDHALIPFFEVIDKSPKHPLATPSRWMVARALEETGDLKLAREFYAQLIAGKTIYAGDATRRVAFINKLFPAGEAGKGAPQGGGKP
jgi:TolA-binding protein